MSEKPDSGTHSRNGGKNGNGKSSANPPYNNSVLYLDFVSGGSSVKLPLQGQIWNFANQKVIETDTVQNGMLSFDVPYYGGISIIDSSSPAIALFRSGWIDVLPQLDIEIFAPDNSVVPTSTVAGGFTPPPTIDSFITITGITPVLNAGSIYPEPSGHDAIRIHPSVFGLHHYFGITANLKYG